MRSVQFSHVIEESKRAGKDSMEFLRVPAMSLSTYRLAAGAVDTQRPHTEDEVYYVVRGRAQFRAADENCAVEPGTVLFVEAGVEHRFHDITEDMELLVVFAPAKSTRAAAGSPTETRRPDRAVSDEAWIRRLLARAPVGTLATVLDGQPFQNMNLFVYDETSHSIYLHTARQGRTRTNIEQDDCVCFSVAEMGRLLPADTALEFSVEYASVIVFGRGVVVENEDEARRGLQLLLDKYAPRLRPGRDYRPITDDELARTSVYRIQIDQWSGKQKKERSDFPGAFLYAPPVAQ